MKYLRAVFLFIVSIFILNSSSFAYNSAGNVWLEPSSSKIYTNSDFDMHIKVDTGSNPLIGYQMEITYDPSVIEIDTQKNGGVDVGSEGFLLITSLDSAQGNIAVMGSNISGSGPSKNLDLLVIHFKALNKPAATFVGIKVKYLKDKNGIMKNVQGFQTSISIKEKPHITNNTKAVQKTLLQTTKNESSQTPTQDNKTTKQKQDNNTEPLQTEKQSIQNDNQTDSKKETAPKPEIESFKAEPDSGIAPLGVNFSWQLSNMDNKTVSCFVDVDSDGTFEYKNSSCKNTSNFTYIYKNPGLYKPTLTLKDSSGLIIKKTQSIDVKPLRKYKLTVSVNNKDEGVVTSTPKGINCGANCSFQYTENSKVTLNAKELTSSIFTQWEGDCSDCKNKKSCIITINTNKQCQAVFNSPPVITMFEVNPQEAFVGDLVDFICSAEDKDSNLSKYTIDFGDGQTKTNTDGKFSHTYKNAKTYSVICSAEDADSISTSKNLEITIKEKQAQKEEKVSKQQKKEQPIFYNLDVYITGGGLGLISISPKTDNYEFEKNTTVSLEAKADSNSIFKEWQKDCEVCDNNTTCTIIMDSDKICYAEFEQKPKEKKNKKPKAEIIKRYKKVAVENPVTLDGSASFDPEKAPLKYRWEIVSKPKNSSVQIKNISSSATFTPDKEGYYTIQLTVDDGEYQDSDNLTIEAIDLAQDNRVLVNSIDNSTSIDIFLPQNSHGKLLNRVIIGKTRKDAVSGVNFPFGTISFTLKTDKTGQTVNIILEFGEKLPKNLALYKVDDNSHYTNIPKDLWSKVDDYTVSLKLTDGGMFDLDGMENGYIEDPVALASVESENKKSGGGGCSISNNSPENGLTLIIILMLSLIWFIFRRRKTFR